MAALKDLIARLEAATEGSRYLDAQIHKYIERDQSLFAKFERSAQAPAADFGMPPTVADQTPHYTTSLDAALTLVPEGWWPGFGWAEYDPKVHKQTGRYGWAELVRNVPGRSFPEEIYGYSDSGSPALAICIAALKAREPQ